MASRALTRQLRSVLESEGVPAALAWLNAGVPHRFTAVYRIDGQRLHNVAFHDKCRAPMPDYLAALDMQDSFCQFVLRDGSLRTRDSASLPILDGNKFQGVVVAYQGVPIRNMWGRLYGTISHFDFVKQPIEEEEFAMLEAAASLLCPYIRDWKPMAVRSHAARSPADPPPR